MWRKEDTREVLMPEEVCGETPYYMLDVLKSKLWPPSTACDREAYWVKRAYDKELFDLVFGLWSGALDIMTFLGMLTVSMGLQDMIGEGLMHKLGGNMFQRINVDYAIPRHAGTALVMSRHGKTLVFQSPVERAGVPGNQETTLHSFTPFDARTVRIGILLAATKYLNCEGLEPISTDLQNARLVTAKENRSHWDGKNPNPGAWNKEVEALEKADLAWRAEEQNRAEIQEPNEKT